MKRGALHFSMGVVLLFMALIPSINSFSYKKSKKKSMFGRLIYGKHKPGEYDDMFKRKKLSNEDRLCLFARRGKLKKIKELIKKGADVNCKCSDGFSPLHLATSKGYADVLLYLIKHGADVNIKGKYGYTPLHLAAKNKRAKIVRILLANGDNPNIKTQNNTLPIAYSMLNRDLDTIRLLLKSGSKLNTGCHICSYSILHYIIKKHFNRVLEIVAPYITKRDIRGGKYRNIKSPPLVITAVESGNLYALRLLKKAGADLSVKDHIGMSLLDIASMRQYMDIVKFLRGSSDIKGKDRYGDTMLHIAAKAADFNEVKRLISKGADVNAKNKLNLTPLHYAVESGDIRIVKYLLKNGADPNAKEKFFKNQPIYYAIDNTHHRLKAHKSEEDYIKIIKLLMDKTQMKAKNYYLWACAKYGSLKMFKLLLSKGGKIDRFDGDGRNCLHLSAYTENIPVMKFILKRYKNVNVNAKDGFRETPLMLACHEGNIKSVKLLLSHGANTETKDNDGQTAIFYAVDSKDKIRNLSIVKILIKHGANVNVKNRYDTPLLRAIRNGSMNIIRELVKNKADVNMGISYDTPLISAIENKRYDIVKYLVENGSDVNLTNVYGYTPLSLCKDVKILKYLVKNGANINATLKIKYMEFANTILHFAAINLPADGVKYLLSKGIHVKKRGWTPLHHVLLHEAPYVGNIKLLIKAGIKLNTKGSAGRFRSATPLHIACAKYPDRSAIRLLVRSGANIKIKDGYGRRPLYYYLRHPDGRNKSIVRLLGGRASDLKRVKKEHRSMGY